MTVTAAAIESLGRPLRLLSVNVAWPQDRVRREARRAGLNPEQLRRGVELGLALHALRVDADHLELLPDWRPAADDLSRGSWDLLAAKLLTSRLLSQQVLTLFQAATPRDQSYEVARAVAHRGAPHAALLLRWGQAHEGHNYVLPAHLLLAHSLIEQPADAPKWVQNLQRVGRRAEQYTLLLERTARLGSVLHVAADSDRYGYDVEVATAGLPRRIEVKGSQGSQVRFFLSKNELGAAARWTENYELHFWGEIDLQRSMDQEYVDLRRAGYPRILHGFHARLSAGEFEFQATEWSVRLLDNHRT